MSKIRDPLKQAIRNGTLETVADRNQFTEETVSELVSLLAGAQRDVHRVMLRAKSYGSLEERRLAKTKGLQRLEREIDEVMRDLKSNNSLLFQRSIKSSFSNGIRGGAETLMKAQLPFYRDLNGASLDKLQTSVFQIIDRDALQFMSGYTVRLAGDVNRELRDGIKRKLLTGVVRGLSSEDLARELGQVIPDKEAFRHAGGRVFPTAQKRLELIARTETLRAHNQGRVMFFQQVGITKIEWLTLRDERVCKVCGPLHEKVFPLDEPLNQPAHPNCRCTHIPAGDFEIDEGGRKNKGGLKPPSTIIAKAKAVRRDRRAREKAFDSGDPSELRNLSEQQTQQLAVDQGVSLWRPKEELLVALKKAGFFQAPNGKALIQLVQSLGIPRRRNRLELLKQLIAAQEAETRRKSKKQIGLDELNYQQLKKLAASYGVSASITRKEVIDIATERYPKIDYAKLSGRELAEVREKLGIPRAKNKRQLIDAIRAQLGDRLARKIIN